jgi:hypothetical protein
MSSNNVVPVVDNQPDLKSRAQKLAIDSLAILKNFDPIALVIAVAALVLFLVLDIHAIVALALAVMTYAGITLVRPHPVPAIQIQTQSEGETAFTLSRESCARMQTLAKEISDPAFRRRARAVPGKFTKMLDVMEEDQKFVSTGDYYSILVHPFERMLGEYVRLSSRQVPSAGPQLRYFERDIVPRTEAVAEAFYQDYHQSDVIDLAALMEIHRLNLDTLSPDDEETGLDEEDDDRNGHEDNRTALDGEMAGDQIEPKR